MHIRFGIYGTSAEAWGTFASLSDAQAWADSEGAEIHTVRVGVRRPPTEGDREQMSRRFARAKRAHAEWCAAQIPRLKEEAVRATKAIEHAKSVAAWNKGELAN